jgi:hypothetical protein
MPHIPTEHFRPQQASLYTQIFENPHINQPATLYHHLIIPLAPFDSGLAEPQPVHTAFRLEFIQLPADDWRKLDGRSFQLDQYEADGSIYLGRAYNPVDIRRIMFTRLGDSRFLVKCGLHCDFEHQGVGVSDTITLQVEAEFKGLLVAADVQTARTLFAALVPPGAYDPEPQVVGGEIWFAPAMKSNAGQ